MALSAEQLSKKSEELDDELDEVLAVKRELDAEAVAMSEKFDSMGDSMGDIEFDMWEDMFSELDDKRDKILECMKFYLEEINKLIKEYEESEASEKQETDAVATSGGTNGNEE